jgi:hypothetical protein
MLLPDVAADQRRRQFKVEGLSGTTYAGGDAFFAVMDNSNKVVRLTIKFNDDGSIKAATYGSAITLSEGHDNEGIAYLASSKTVLISNEDEPAVREFRTDGSIVSALPTPRVFRAPNLRGNFGFESLAANDAEFWTANEEALASDGALSNLKHGSVVRLLRYRQQNGRFEPSAQFAYVTDPIHRAHSDADDSMSRSGVSDLVLLPDGSLAALERSFALLGPSNLLSDFRNRIYLVDCAGATDVSAGAFAGGLLGKKYEPVKKRLIFDHTGTTIGNLEGLCVGPKLANGSYAMVGVVDNNGIRMLANRLIAFELRIGAAPASQPARTETPH